MKKYRAIIVIIIFLFIMPENVMATESTDTEMTEESMLQAILEQMDAEEMDRCLKELFPNESLNFQKMVMTIVKGDLKSTIKNIGHLLFDELFLILKTSKKSIFMMITTASLAAIYKQITIVFEEEQMLKNGYYVFTMLMVMLCFGTFIVIFQWIEVMIRRMVRFMAVFYPLFFIFVAISKGSISAVSFYELALFLIYIVEFLVGKVFMGFIQVYMMISLVNQLMGEGRLTKLCEFFETMISWGIKSTLAGVIGLSIVQGMISPSLDQVKRSVVTKGIEAIPGVGNVIGGSAETLLALASLIKNGVGIGGVIICFFLCMIPLSQIALASLMFHLIAAILEPVSDESISNCIMNVSVGCKLLMKIVYSTGVLFLTTIILVSAVTNHV